MARVSRRSLLTGLGAATVAGSAQAKAPSRGAPWGGLAPEHIAEALRARWDRDAARLDSGFQGGATAVDSDDPLPAASRLAARGFGALGAFKALETVPVEEQAHPAVQSLVLDVAEAVGAALIDCRGHLEAFLEAAAAPGGERDAESQLHGAIAELRLGLRGWDLAPHHVRQVDDALGEVQAETDPGRLRRRVQRLLRRFERVEALAAGWLERRYQTDLLEPRDSGARARFEAGLARYAAAGSRLPSWDGVDERRPGLVALGIVVLGVGVLLGCFVVIMGICAIGCGGGIGGVLILLLGIGIVVLAAWGGARWIKKGRGRPELGPVPEPAAAPG
jgi:hypothetical protein